MKEFNASAVIVETNRYNFKVQANSKEEAETKLNDFLFNHFPINFQATPINGVLYVDREASLGMEGVELITIK